MQVWHRQRFLCRYEGGKASQAQSACLLRLQAASPRLMHPHLGRVLAGVCLACLLTAAHAAEDTKPQQPLHSKQDDTSGVQRP